MSGKIFINYRRGDDAGFTQALYLRLEDEFGADDLFMDVEGHIKPGDDFVHVLSAQVSAADILLVIIGPRWMTLLSERQGDADDFVVVEIKAALDNGKRVIPVLVGMAGMPRADLLPESIRSLARRNAVGLRPDRFKADCQGLVTSLKESLASAERERDARSAGERMAAEAARREAEEQASLRAKATEERGRSQAAAGLSQEEIRRAEEMASWEFVKDRNSVYDLRDHLARFSGGQTERYARAKLDVLSWAALGRSPSVGELQNYVNEFPKGTGAVDATARIEAAEAKASAAAEEAKLREQETADWLSVATSADPKKIKAFLEKWPYGKYRMEARKQLLLGSSTPRKVALGGAAIGFVVLVGIVANANLNGNQVVYSPSYNAPPQTSGQKLGLAELKRRLGSSTEENDFFVLLRDVRAGAKVRAYAAPFSSSEAGCENRCLAETRCLAFGSNVSINSCDLYDTQDFLPENATVGMTMYEATMVGFKK